MTEICCNREKVIPEVTDIGVKAKHNGTKRGQWTANLHGQFCFNKDVLKLFSDHHPSLSW